MSLGSKCARPFQGFLHSESDEPTPSLTLSLENIKALALGRNLRFMRRICSIRQYIKVIRAALHPSVFPFLSFAPPGHFYSPIPRLQDSHGPDVLLDAAWAGGSGLDLCDAAQVRLLAELSKSYAELPAWDRVASQRRYSFQNSWFKDGDAIVLYGMLRSFYPKKIIEIGSGFSSAAMLDVNDQFLGHSVKFTFIEPNPERLRTLLREPDLADVAVIEKPVQEVPPYLFRELEANDVLFVDSSHIAKLGSDVNHIVFNILPQLKPGVLVHFHDIRWPFEYPRSTTEMGIAWNEAYFLRAFLMFNGAFRIRFFNSYMAELHAELIRKEMPRFMNWPGGSIWIQRIQ